VLEGQPESPGCVAIDKEVSFDAGQWKTLEKLIADAGFWRTPTRSEPTDSNGLETDGDALILEGVTGGAYHIVERQELSPAFEKLCRQMLALTGLKVQSAWRDYHPDDEVQSPDNPVWPRATSPRPPRGGMESGGFR
jgi:hypothetical protein